MTINPMTPERRYQYALSFVLNNEGGCVDLGEETNFGITQNDILNYHKINPEFPDSVKDLTRKDAEKFYYDMFWNKYCYEGIHSLVIATKVFDLAVNDVNMGPKKSHMILQKALNSLGHKISVDGILGAQTFNAVNCYDTEKKENMLLNIIRMDAAACYMQIVKDNPSLKKFYFGWLKRAAK